MWRVKWFCCFILLQCFTVYAQQDECTSKMACRECISTPSCQWCSERVAGEANEVHCVDKSRTKDPGWCHKESIMAYESKYKAEPDEKGKHQIHPQKAHLRLRLGEEHKIQIKFIQEKNYPVDLYYLMDLSKSMEDDKEKVSSLGEGLTDAIKNLTENFRLGFGSFVDKRALPFVSTVPSKLQEPCPGCAPPYSFKNHMPLDSNTNLFAKTVINAAVSGNLDSPEGGFDALMQAMVCTEHIKWRANARHLLVFSTDAAFHIAGDGRLAGIIEPNDGQCHMNDKNEYTDELLYDYPSIAQIDNKVIEKDVRIIFAVDESQERVYKPLTQHITGSSFGTLTTKSTNVVQLVSGEFKKLTQSITMTGRANKQVDIKFYSNCLEPDKELKETNRCDDVKQEDEIIFEARIKVTECPVNDIVWKDTIQFKPLGINETMEVNLEVICGCECETKLEINSDKCNRNGTLKCGICECNKGSTGRVCECDERSTSLDNDDTPCRKDNTSEVCSDHGSCRCGVCNCYTKYGKELYSGKYCECDNFACAQHNDKLCSGPSNGRCKCGECKCYPGWKGDACEIVDDPKGCIDPATNKVCTNRGQCVDGKCICDQQKYTGPYCEDCVFCHGSRCKELGDCVECLVYRTGSYADRDVCNSYCNLTVTDIVDKLTEENVKSNEHFCQLPDGSSCTIIFTYQEMHGKVNVTAQRDKDCRQAENVFAVIFGVVGATIFIGLLFILIWKLLTMIHDRREYAKFEKERAQAKFDRGENPLYKGAVSKFDNPIFNSS